MDTDDARRSARQTPPEQQHDISYQGDIAPSDMTVSPHSKPKLDTETKEIGGPGDPRRIAVNASADTFDAGTETPDSPTPPTNITSDAIALHPGTPPTPPEIPQEAAAAELIVPTITSINPATAVHSTDPDFGMTVTGTGFNPGTVITFNGGDEPTTFISDTEVMTTVKPSLVGAPIDVPVTVRNGSAISEPSTFSFT